MIASPWAEGVGIHPVARAVAADPKDGARESYTELLGGDAVEQFAEVLAAMNDIEVTARQEVVSSETLPASKARKRAR
jgi:hypothetical protein